MVVREWFHRRYVGLRRRRLLAAYAKEFRIRTGKRVGFSPHLYALMEAEKDGVLEVKEDGTVDWMWPEGECGGE